MCTMRLLNVVNKKTLKLIAEYENQVRGYAFSQSLSSFGDIGAYTPPPPSGR